MADILLPPLADGDGGDRIIIRLDPGGPIELSGLAESFAALSRMYERHYRPDASADAAPRLFLTRLETGSVLAEIVPLAVLFGTAVSYMDTSMVVSDFSRRLWAGLRAFSTGSIETVVPPSKEDARDLREFVRPLAGKNGAELGITHARYHKKDGSRETIVEYRLEEAEINRASLAIDESLGSAPSPHNGDRSRSRRLKEVMLFIHQTNRSPGKEVGKTSDKAIVPEVSDRPLPVHFRDGIQDLKELMVRGRDNPLTTTFVVDVVVNEVEGKPRGYVVTDVHRVMSDE